MKFFLGDGPGGDLQCDLQRLVDTRLLIQANSGAGKSWLLRRLLEQTHGHVQHIVIDPEGEFSSLREMFDYVLAAPSGGDTQAHPRTAKLLAERLLELTVSAVLDIYDLKYDQRIAFVRHFLETVIDAPKKLWHPAIIVVDEAHLFCPEKGDAESAAAVIDLMTRGRKRGYCGVLATQRLAKLRKDAAAECNNRLIGRTGLDIDVKRAAEELGFSKDRWGDLKRLDEGEFFAFGPALSREVVKVMIGPVKTHHPKAGSRIAFKVPPPTDTIKAMLPQLADLPQEAEARQKSIDDLKRETLRLRRDLVDARKAAPPAPERIEVPVLSMEDRERLTAAADIVKLAADDIIRRLNTIPLPLKSITWNPAREAKHFTDEAARIPKPVLQEAARGHGEMSDGLTGPEQRILDAIAWMASIGQSEPLQTAVAFLAGYSIGGGAFNNPRGSLRTKGYVVYLPGERIAMTHLGKPLARNPVVDLTPEEMQRRVLARLPGPERKILEVLIAAYPGSLTKESLAKHSGYADGGGAFNNPCGRLRSLGLIEYVGTQRRASPVLFLEES